MILPKSTWSLSPPYPTWLGPSVGSGGLVPDTSDLLSKGIFVFPYSIQESKDLSLLGLPASLLWEGEALALFCYRGRRASIRCSHKGQRYVTGALHSVCVALTGVRTSAPWEQCSWERANLTRWKSNVRRSKRGGLALAECRGLSCCL